MVITSCPNCGDEDITKEAQIDGINDIEEVYTCNGCRSEIVAEYVLQDIDFTTVKYV